MASSQDFGQQRMVPGAPVSPWSRRAVPWSEAAAKRAFGEQLQEWIRHRAMERQRADAVAAYRERTAR